MATKKPVKRITLPSKGNPSPKVVKEEKSSDTKVSTKTRKKAKKNYLLLPFTGTWAYITGSWHELRQVRWPNRSATWGLTLAVILFTVFFAVIIILLDLGFNYLFKEVLLK